MSDSHQELIVIRTFADGISAAIAHAALEANDIPAIVVGDDAGGVHPALTFAHGVRLAVRHGDAVRALHVLDHGPSDFPPEEPENTTAGDIPGPPAA
jgi:pimeloyl-ACP methyl ester carboxylesterase